MKSFIRLFYDGKDKFYIININMDEKLLKINLWISYYCLLVLKFSTIRSI